MTALQGMISTQRESLSVQWIDAKCVLPVTPQVAAIVHVPGGHAHVLPDSNVPRAEGVAADGDAASVEARRRREPENRGSRGGPGP